jgi:hypothetical protein
MTNRTKRRLSAAVAVMVAGYLWVKVGQRLFKAEEELEGELEGETRAWNLLPTGIVAVAAVIVAIQRTQKALAKVRRARQAGSSGEELQPA